MIKEQKIIAICVSDIQNDAIQDLIYPIHEYFSKHGWKVIVYSSCTNLRQNTPFDRGEACVFQLIDEKFVDAILLCPQELQRESVLQDIILYAQKYQIPVLSVDDTKKREGCIHISFEKDQAFQDLIVHLITEHHFTKIHCIAGFQGDPVSEKRLACFRRILAEYDIPFAESMIGYGNFYAVPTQTVLDQFLSASTLPEAIVCLDDTMAITVCEALQERGIRVPEQIVVTGFGGIDQGQYCFPRLTTCRRDPEKFPAFLLEILQNADHGNSIPSTYQFPFSAHFSESCGCKTCSYATAAKTMHTMYNRMTNSAQQDRSMNDMIARLTKEHDKETIKDILKYYIPFDSYLCINTDFCTPHQIHHNDQSMPFTSTMNSYRFFFGDSKVHEKTCMRNQLIPDPACIVTKTTLPIVFAIHNQQNTYGYMVAFAGNYRFSVRRMQRFMMNLDSCIGMYAQQFYLRASTQKMQEIQDKIILSFADLVESRDNLTGQHIKRTGEYLRVLVRHLSTLPKYAEVLTPEVQHRMYAAAPLHDIGKIKISDLILNKPGRLTDEEFEVIKTHTAAGSEIIERTLTDIENDDYLTVAYQMALYHHEKWDGTGYMHHLAGEDIPLCARIMAVVDVFDALTSKRVYKDAMSFEQALQVLEASKGTHFDPAIVDAFLSIRDEIKEILTEHLDDANLETGS